jgi:hypothetical protein
MYVCNLCTLHAVSSTKISIIHITFKYISSYGDHVGHHPALVNPYISKVYENIVELQYKTVIEENLSAYHVLGVVSRMGERLDFPEVMELETH